MKDTKLASDVFLSYSFEDRASAEVVGRALANVGLNVFDPAIIETGSSPTDAIWQALAESDALVVIVSRDGAPNPNTAAELGAALAWQKPIYLVSNDNGRTRIPPFLTGQLLYPISRIDDVARAIKQGPQPLSANALETLRDVYLEQDTPTDQLIKNPALLDRLAKRFNAKTRSQVPAERLLYEMIRLRKQGRWPRLGRARGAKTKA